MFINLGWKRLLQHGLPGPQFKLQPVTEGLRLVSRTQRLLKDHSRLAEAKEGMPIGEEQQEEQDFQEGLHVTKLGCCCMGFSVSKV
eukprot:scaffold62802_cov14-Tisochrysis_lutea.AAC.2